MLFELTLHVRFRMHLTVRLYRNRKKELPGADNRLRPGVSALAYSSIGLCLLTFDLLVFGLLVFSLLVFGLLVFGLLTFDLLGFGLFVFGLLIFGLWICTDCSLIRPKSAVPHNSNENSPGKSIRTPVQSRIPALPALSASRQAPARCNPLRCGRG